MGNIASQNRPRSQVENQNEFNEIQDRQAGAEKHSHPHHPLVVHEMQNVFRNFEVAVLVNLIKLFIAHRQS